ncbi:MAG TPA: cytochrome C oxidase subunit IV family protein [Thermoanaerobaculia bacterium]|nr:cytochrome C oxidase subunit IV family protein [Thermoanaerobaculia bacterium]
MSEHVVPVRSYVAVFVVLLIMTGTTTAVSFLDLGPWNTVVALAIAFFKATLVVLIFMHVKYSPRLTTTVIVGGLFWLAILIALTLGDFATRTSLPRLKGLHRSAQAEAPAGSARPA